MINQHKSILIILTIFCIIICGCTTTAKTYNEQHSNVVWGEYQYDVGTVTKLEIREDNVTCYIYESSYKGGISCLRNAPGGV